jgi:ribosomal protein S18 acetylase RimI-like enzyme
MIVPKEPLNPHIAPLRHASRKLVREWGFLRPNFAGTPLSPAAVHCLIEIGDSHTRSSSGLCTELRVAPEQLDCIVSELVDAGYVAAKEAAETALPEPNAHVATYRLTAGGEEILCAINAYAQEQVTKALAAVPPDAVADITSSFRLYATALERASAAADVSTPQSSRPASPGGLSAAAAPARVVRIETGYRPGLVARALDMHISYYSRTEGWGVEFETDLGAILSNLVSRLGNPLNQAWSAVETIFPQSPGSNATERIVGVIFIDGQIPGKEGSARLRAFIVEDNIQGLGLGRKLFQAAMSFVIESGFRECRLMTMRHLLAARRLYEEGGFKEVAEVMKPMWGTNVADLEYCWTRPSEHPADRE